MKLKKRGNSPTPSNSISTAKDVFGPPALIEGENLADYVQMVGHISAAVKPKDFFEEIWVRDVADLTWDCLRMRRLKAALLSSVDGEGLETLLRPLLGYTDAQELAKRWVVGDEEAVTEADQHLASIGLDIHAVMARALVSRLEQVEGIERMSMNAEARRNAALREIDRHRAQVAATLRAISDQVIDGNLVEVVPKQQLEEALRP